MLKELIIKNMATIESLSLSLKPGFNVLTGETGAGKSIIIGSLEFLLGEKTDPEIIRTGANTCEIVGVFEVTSDELASFLAEKGFDSDELVIRRVLPKDGRSKSYVNDVPVSLNTLKELGNYLVDIHGQHQHQLLLKPENHLEILDLFGNLTTLREEYKKIFTEWKRTKERINQLERMEQERLNMMDLLSFQIKEIEEAALSPEEEQELVQRYEKLSNIETIRSSLEETHNLLYEAEPNAVSLARKSLHLIEKAVQYDPALEEIRKPLEESLLTLEETTYSIRDYISKLAYDPEELANIRERLDLINSLKRKYGESIEEILNFLSNAKKKLKELKQSSCELEELKEKLPEIEKKLDDLAGKLSLKRKEISVELAGEVVKHFKEIALEKAVFIVRIEKQEKNSYGQDRVEFLISTNPGEEPKPLRKVASGGEISRIMLALKTVLADVDRVETLVFDEIDVGISGRISYMVGKKMKQIGRKRQVICVTHSPQIAALADHHIRVFKEVRGGKTYTSVKPLSLEERKEEIAKLLGGEKITPTALEHARQLLEEEHA